MTKESTTTPFDMVVLNDLDRFHLVGDVIDRLPQLGARAAYAKQAIREKPARPEGIHRRTWQGHARNPQSEVGPECGSEMNMSEAFPKLYLARHGETAWSISGQHTGRADIPLTNQGERNARSLGARLKGLSFVKVLTSPLQRAKRTSELAGLGTAFGPRTGFVDNLVERLSVCDCPVNELGVHIFSHQNFLHRAGLLLTPRYISRRLLLKHVEDLSGNIYDLLTHLTGMAAVVWVFFTTPDTNGIHGEPEIAEFPIFDREITLQNSPCNGCAPRRM